MPAPRKFAIGDRVWKFDENRRVYDTKKSWGPIYREHYIEYEVVGIEGRSYVLSLVYRGTTRVGGSRSVPVARAERDFLTDQEMKDDVYRNTHRHTLVDLLLKADAATLIRVAEVLGYEGETS